MSWVGGGLWCKDCCCQGFVFDRQVCGPVSRAWVSSATRPTAGAGATAITSPSKSASPVLFKKCSCRGVGKGGGGGRGRHVVGYWWVLVSGVLQSGHWFKY
jgi:hypothetical protein